MSLGKTETGNKQTNKPPKQQQMAGREKQGNAEKISRKTWKEKELPAHLLNTDI